MNAACVKVRGGNVCAVAFLGRVIHVELYAETKMCVGFDEAILLNLTLRSF